MDSDLQYIPLLEQRLSKYRFVHSLNVAESARLLAEKYGGDEQKAHTAGLLHDIMKDASPDEQLQIMESGGIVLLGCERLSKKLWHAMSGAIYIRDVLKITDEDIFNAVRYHTTGREGMSLLEKIIFIADYISADRTYDGIDKMRALAAESLEKAMEFGLEFTIVDLAQRGKLIHPDSVACYNELMSRNLQE